MAWCTLPQTTWEPARPRAALSWPTASSHPSESRCAGSRHALLSVGCGCDHSLTPALSTCRASMWQRAASLQSLEVLRPAPRNAWLKKQNNGICDVHERTTASPVIIPWSHRHGVIVCSSSCVRLPNGLTPSRWSRHTQQMEPPQRPLNAAVGGIHYSFLPAHGPPATQPSLCF